MERAARTLLQATFKGRRGVLEGLGPWEFEADCLRGSEAHDRYWPLTTSPCSLTTTYATFLSTKAEFLEPNAIQLHTACSIFFLRPGNGT